jgi:perosamine synthetase
MTQTMSDAIPLAGRNEPIRIKPFEPTCFISGNEIELVTECLTSRNWSSFKGGTEGWKLEDCIKMPSVRAATYGGTEIRFLGGKFVRQLEADVARASGVEFAVSANSATSALVMAVGALDIEPGDEIIVPCLSFNASATAILFYNAIPVFCEIKTDTLCIDPADLEKKITPRTKAIMVVHFAGNTCDMDAIMSIAKRHGLKVIEDCAQSPGVAYKGRAVGSIGDAGVFSYTETKNISCGEGGMLITNDPRAAMKARLIRNHGEGVTEGEWSDDDLANIVGMNFRLTEIQAAVAVPQFESLTGRNAIRNENWRRLVDGLSSYADELTPFRVEDGAQFVCHVMYWRWRPRRPGRPDRAALIAALRELGIPVGVAYGRLMHENPLYTNRVAYGRNGYPWNAYPVSEQAFASYGTGACPRTEALNRELISFRFVNPPNSIRDMDDVVAAFCRVLG